MYLIKPEGIMKLAIQIMVTITYRDVLCQMNMKINVKNYIEHVIKKLLIHYIPQHIKQPGYCGKKNYIIRMIKKTTTIHINISLFFSNILQYLMSSLIHENSVIEI